MSAADVILVIVAADPGCARAHIDAHPGWLSAPGWGKPADLSTISRAAKGLERDGLISRNRDGSNWQVLDKGRVRALAAASVWAEVVPADVSWLPGEVSASV